MSIKEALKTVKESVLEQYPGDSAATAADALVIIAMTALKELQGESDDAECCAAARQARKALKPFLSSSGPNSEKLPTTGKRAREDEKSDAAVELDMGQYADTGAFEGNEAKKNKFARLLGGGKSSGGAKVQHHTHAASASAVDRINKDLSSQFDYAMHHKGKKGLGA